MRILQINTADFGGGAEAVAWQLFQGYRRLGHVSWLAVGCKESRDEDVFLIRHDKFRHLWARVWVGMADRLQPVTGRIRGVDRLRTLCAVGIGQPGRWCNRAMGLEDFAYPGVWHLAELLPAAPDVLHCHNLHGAWLPDGGYFDLTALPELSRTYPLVATLHDAWLLSGHCAHSFECERWRTGCGSCPDLTIYPSVRRDATAQNWLRKQRIFSKSRLYLSTPSHWLMQKVEQSMLSPAVVESRVIPNGVNLDVFRPTDKRRVRAELGLPLDAKVLLFAAHGIRKNLWKDYATMRGALEEVGRRMRGQEVIFVALGEGGEAEQVGRVTMRFVPFTTDPADVARYYQGADVYLHAARADTFPNTVLEALACGTPVVATAVGGIPEQVHDGRTGFLVPPGDVETMASRTVDLLSREDVLGRFGEEAARVAGARFDVRAQVTAYATWLEEIVDSHKRQREGMSRAGRALRDDQVGISH